MKSGLCIYGYNAESSAVIFTGQRTERTAGCGVARPRVGRWFPR